jgi:hypothetical protein
MLIYGGWSALSQAIKQQQKLQGLIYGLADALRYIIFTDVSR